ncbi:MAG TPA: hypothetical protein V6C81_22555 [Planktothrix sp.]
MDNRDDKGFENAWFSPYAIKESGANTTESRSASEALSDVRDFAYTAFDRLDNNKNGFIELSELSSALHDTSLSEREKSFVSFLLNNHDQIAKSFNEGSANNQGISRPDLEAYFKLVLSLLD